MFSSLRLKLLASFFLVIVIGVGTIAYISSNSAINQFDRYVSRDQAERYQRLALTFSNYYRYMGSWDEVSNLTAKVSEMYNERIVLTDPSGVVIGDTAEKLIGEEIVSDWSNKSVTINLGDFSIGKIYIRTQQRSPLQKTFINSVNKSVLTGGIIAGIVGIVLALLFSRNILKPIRELTEATKKMQQGELDQRVDTSAGGEIGKLGESFNELARRLKEQKTLREEMVSDVAHELRNPLSNIQGYLEGLREGMIDPTKKVFETLHQQSLVLNRLVNDLRDVNRAKAGKLNLDKKLLVLEDIISREIKALKAKAEENGVEISKNLNGPNLIEADPERISQVVRNLIDNAITHTPEEGEIKIETRTSSGEVRTTVTDDGAGIPEKDLPYIFDRFYRVDKSRSRGTGGTGLGLTIAKEIIESHGGKITAKSREGEGSTFEFALPLPE
ncbi:MAG: HAMP domain-containing sensor histidine kinase [Candidatus Bipolaricaulota bacterium]|nr:HAMP domain-containing histidine kinase [Candidatus Bipolaricaulota bacterium]